MIRVVQGFELLTRDAVDWRLVLTKKQMREINDNQMPDKYFSICRDDGLLYAYDKDREFDDDDDGTGKFYPYANNRIESITINGKVIPVDDDNNINLPLISKNNYGVAKAGAGLAVDNGVVSIDFNAAEDYSIPFKKINFDQLIIDAND